MATDGHYEVKTAPSLQKLAASNRKPAPPAKGKEKVGQPKKLSKDAVQYAMDRMPGGLGGVDKTPSEEARLQAALWEQICGYRRRWPELVHDRNIHSGVPSQQMKAEIKNLQNQKGDDKAVAKAQTLYIMWLGMIERVTGAYNPMGWDLGGGKLVRAGADAVYNQGFLLDDLTEITIIYPWLFRHGPEMNIIFGTWQLIQSVNMGTKVGEAAQAKVPQGTADAWSDL